VVNEVDIQRFKLPFRLNCEGYFVNDNFEILAKMTEHGYFVFPGGGVRQNESVEIAMRRETLEETGASVLLLQEVGNMKLVWDKLWAQTDKQRERYKKFQGEDMHFFIGKIGKIDRLLRAHDDSWMGEILVPIDVVIANIRNQLRYDSGMKKYRELQLQFLQRIQYEKI
jgi:hypothetical protein